MNPSFFYFLQFPSQFSALLFVSVFFLVTVLFYAFFKDIIGNLFREGFFFLSFPVNDRESPDSINFKGDFDFVSLESFSVVFSLSSLYPSINEVSLRRAVVYFFRGFFMYFFCFLGVKEWQRGRKRDEGRRDASTTHRCFVSRSSFVARR